MTTSNTSGGLLGFVNQLQNMESSMSQMLMETALKLAAMADISVFVLVEHSSGGRSFSGKRHLCDAYLSSTLSPTEVDVELEINPEISALQERLAGETIANDQRYQQHRRQLQQHHPSFNTKSHTSEHRSPNSRKRSHHSTGPTTSSTSPKRFHSNAEDSDSMPLTADLKPELIDEDAAAAASSIDVVGSQAFDVDDDDDVICEDGENYDDADFEITATHSEELTANNDAITNSYRRYDDDNYDVTTFPAAPIRKTTGLRFQNIASMPDSSSTGLRTENALPMPISDSISIVANSSEKDWIFSEMVDHPKLEAVKRIHDAESVADKNSVPSKILNSLLYDLAKMAAAKCPFRSVDDARCKQFYVRCFEEIWNGFLPNLKELDERDVAAKKASSSSSCLSPTSNSAARERSIRTCCRDLFRRNFFTLVRRQNKKENEKFLATVLQ